MRRKEKQLKIEEAVEIIKKGEYGILSMVTVDNGAYGVPLNYVYKDQCIYFHCAVEGYKLKNLQHNNDVSFCIVGSAEVLPDKLSTKYESVIISGEAAEVEGDEKYNALLELIKKYSSSFMEKGIKYLKNDINKTVVIRIDIKNISGKRNRD